MIIVPEKNIDLAFKKEADIQLQLENAKNSLPQDDRFFGITHQDNFDKSEATLFGDIWKYPKQLHNSRRGGYYTITAYSTWYDEAKYNTNNNGATPEELYLRSEREKILFKNKQYRIVLLRERLDSPNSVYYGYCMSSPVYALIDKNDNVLCTEEKAWRFKKLLMGTTKEKKEKTFVDTLRTFNPFKHKIINSLESDEVEKMCQMLEFSIDKPHISNKKIWVVCLLGHYSGKGRDYSRDKNSTWFYVESEEEPTIEESFLFLKEKFLKYQSSDFVEYLTSCQERGENLNAFDFEQEKRFHYVLNGKFKWNFEKVFGSNYRTLLEVIE